MSEQTVNADVKQARLAVVDVAMPDRPATTIEAPFWEGTKEERTFFVRNVSGSLHLLVPASDPRSAGMWDLQEEFSTPEDQMADHRGWWVSSHDVAYIDDEPETHDELVVLRADQSIEVAYPVGSVWNHSTYGDERFTIMGYDVEPRGSTHLVVRTQSGVDQNWSRTALDSYGILVAQAPAVDEREVAELKDMNVRLDETNVELRRQIRELQELLNQRVAQHEADVALIGDTLMTEACNRSWCSEYDQVVTSLNELLGIALPVRDHEYTVWVDVTYRVAVNVSATDSDAAEQKATEDSQQLYDAISRWDGPENTEIYDVRDNN